MALREYVVIKRKLCRGSQQANWLPCIHFKAYTNTHTHTGSKGQATWTHTRWVPSYRGLWFFLSLYRINKPEWDNTALPACVLLLSAQALMKWRDPGQTEGLPSDIKHHNVDERQHFMLLPVTKCCNILGTKIENDGSANPHWRLNVCHCNISVTGYRVNAIVQLFFFSFFSFSIQVIGTTGPIKRKHHHTFLPRISGSLCKTSHVSPPSVLS